MCPRGLAWLTLAPWLGLSAGCQLFGAIVYFFGPPHVQKAEYRLTAGRLAIVTDFARPDQEHPVFARALNEKLVEFFREKKVNTQVVPWEEVADLPRANPDYTKWSVQQIGRACNAEQVLYLRIDSLDLREEPQHPVISPSVTLRIKVIDVQAPAQHARLWPPDGQERTVTCQRDASEATGPAAIDAAALKLGRDTAHHVARFFYDVDLEEPVARER